MQVVIDIPDDTYRWIKKNHYVPGDFIKEVCEAIKEGKSLSKDHGKLIDANEFNKYLIGQDRSFQELLKNIPAVVEIDNT